MLTHGCARCPWSNRQHGETRGLESEVVVADRSAEEAAFSGRGPGPPGAVPVVTARTGVGRRVRHTAGDAIAHLKASDPAMARLIATVGPCGLEIRSAGSTFAALAESITHQQLTGRAAAAIHARLCALFDDPASGPSPEVLAAMPDEALRGCGLSGAKVLALRDLAARTLAGEVPTLPELRSLDSEEVIRRLTTIRGIGRWTVEMLLVFRLGHPDILAVDDYGLRKGFRAAVGLGTGRGGLPTPRELAVHGARWAPYRSAASWYLWRAVDGL